MDRCLMAPSIRESMPIPVVSPHPTPSLRLTIHLVNNIL